MDSANAKEVVIADKIHTFNNADIDFEKLELQLQLLPDAIKAVPLQGIAITHVTKVQTIFQEQSSLKVMLSNIHKLMLIFLTVPITTATAERSFSALRCIKTYLRNSMTQQRLNHCLILHVHREKTDNLNLTEVAQEFIERNDSAANKSAFTLECPCYYNTIGYDAYQFELMDEETSIVSSHKGRYTL